MPTIDAEIRENPRNWRMKERIKKVNTQIIVYQKIRQEFGEEDHYKICVYRRSLGEENVAWFNFHDWLDVKWFFESIEGKVFFKGKFITRKEMSRECHFTNLIYPDWFREKVVKAVVNDGMSMTQACKKFEISVVAGAMWLKDAGFKHKKIYGNANRYGFWEKKNGCNAKVLE